MQLQLQIPAVDLCGDQDVPQQPGVVLAVLSPEWRVCSLFCALLLAFPVAPGMFLNPADLRLPLLGCIAAPQAQGSNGKGLY